MALSAAVQKRDFLRKRRPELNQAFLVAICARLVVVPAGLDDVARRSGEPSDFAKRIVARLDQVLRQDGEACRLMACLDGFSFDSAAASFKSQVLRLRRPSRGGRRRDADRRRRSTRGPDRVGVARLRIGTVLIGAPRSGVEQGTNVELCLGYGTPHTTAADRRLGPRLDRPALAFIATALDRNYQTDFWHHLARGRAMAEGGLVAITTCSPTPSPANRSRTQLADRSCLLPPVRARRSAAGADRQLPGPRPGDGRTGGSAGGSRNRCCSPAGRGVHLLRAVATPIRPQTFPCCCSSALYGTLELSDRRQLALLVAPFILALWANLHWAVSRLD